MNCKKYSLRRRGVAWASRNELKVNFFSLSDALTRLSTSLIVLFLYMRTIELCSTTFFSFSLYVFILLSCLPLCALQPRLVITIRINTHLDMYQNSVLFRIRQRSWSLASSIFTSRSKASVQHKRNSTFWIKLNGSICMASTFTRCW